MKTRKLFTAGILALGLMTACSNEDEPNVNNGNNGETTYAQIAINMVSSNAATRAVEGSTGDTNAGTEGEQTVTNLTVVLTDANNIVQEIYPNQTLKTGGTNAANRATEPFEIPAGSYKVYVLANYTSTSLGSSIAKGSDISGVFNISNFSQLTVANNFLMANAEMPTTTTDFSGTANDDEVNDDLTTESNPEKVHLVNVNLERVVSKVTFDQSTTTFDINDASGSKIASTTINAVALINLNKKMYLVREAKAATNYPDGVSDWIYPEDPNYNHSIANASTDATWLSENFDKASAPTEDFKTDFSAATFYCPENTMLGSNQQHGQTTGVVYKVTYTPEANAYTSLAASSGTSTYDQLFEAVLALDDKDTDITSSIFTTADTESTNFYAYNGLIFKNQNAAILYKAIAEDKTSGDNATRAAAINAQFTSWKSSVPADVLKYAEGVSYYTAWIRHNPDADAGNMEQDKYGVVRNHWYELTVNSISGLGYNEPTYENPEDPDDKAVANIQVAATIKPWRIVKQSVDL